MTEWDLEKVAQLSSGWGVRSPSSMLDRFECRYSQTGSALKVIGYKDPIGRTMKSGDRELTIGRDRRYS